MWAWGRNNAGQLGDGTVVTRSSPVQIGALTDWNDVDIGSYHTIAKKTNGTLWAWGNNQRGQLGTNNLTYRSSPVQVGALTTWSTIAAGNRHSMATKTDGTLWAWGYNFQGQLGINLAYSYQHRSSPVQVGALTTWSKASAGGNRSGAVKTDGTLWMWGLNNSGNLGDLTTVNRSSPVQVGIATDWATLHLSLNGETSVGIKTTGTLWSWGSNSTGTLGINNAAITAVSSPVQVGALTNWSSASLNAHVIATKTDGTLWSWGQGAFGALGNNQVLNASSPVQVGSLTLWKNPSAGSTTGFAILEQLSN
jgi:alpha-tubulin suppressor-like RCC1 family protein